MSHLSAKETICPHCKQPTDVELWTAMNVKDDPELKDLLLGGEINMVECDSCREVFYAEAFLLYHDPANELMAMVYPSDQKEMEELLAEKTLADFHKGQELALEGERVDYEPVALFGLNDLVAIVEKIEEESLQSEVAEAIAKLNKLPYRKIGPWLGRTQGLPRLLPLDAAEKDRRASILKGLRRLHEINDRLTVFNAALERLSTAPAAEIRLS